MSPAEYGRQLAATRAPLTDSQVEDAARILALLDEEAVAA